MVASSPSIAESISVPGYRIAKRIGQGGAATVYLAVQESLDRPVALKVLTTAQPDDPTYSQRFLNEGRIIASLSHRNIITIHDVGVHDGIHYITMEHVAGGDLGARLRGGIAPDDALGLIASLGAALEFAHGAGVVHRDVKPANILFRTDGTPLLTDFGIAKRLSDDLTVGGLVLGTPGYLSPEQARGEPVDGRSDVYALGMLLYEMLVGERPYRAETEISTILKQLQEPVPPLPGALRRYQPLLDKMVAKNREDRFPDMAAVLGAINTLTGRGAIRRPGRKRVWVAGTGALVVAILIAAGAALLPGSVDPLRRPSALAPVTAPAAVGASVQATRLERLNALGRDALETGRLADPPGDSALGYFREALALDPDNVPASDGLEAIAARASAASEAAYAQRAFSLAQAQAEVGLAARPGDPRLRELLDKSVERQARVASLIAAGEEAFADNRLTTPENDNALHYYSAALAIEPGNSSAADGKASIVTRYVELARSKIARYRYADARTLIQRGLRVAPKDERLLALSGKADIKHAPGQLVDDIKQLFD